MLKDVNKALPSGKWAFWINHRKNLMPDLIMERNQISVSLPAQSCSSPHGSTCAAGFCIVAEKSWALPQTCSPFCRAHTSSYETSNWYFLCLRSLLLPKMTPPPHHKVILCTRKCFNLQCELCQLLLCIQISQRLLEAPVFHHLHNQRLALRFQS